MDCNVTFEQLGLSSEILRAVADEGYTVPTPVQERVIPLILAGRDIMASAQTGTGKTAGFTLPLLYRLQMYASASTSPARHPIRALIIAPTRELAIQIGNSVKRYGKYLAVRSAVVFGGVSIEPQVAEMQAGIEILVATPGRLLDLIERKVANFSKTEVLILDEADRMLDMGFLPDIKKVMALLPSQRQSLMFSATFSDEIKKLANGLLQHPVQVEVAAQNTVNKSISHVIHRVVSKNKFALLQYLIKKQNLESALVFVKTKHGASQLARMLVRRKIQALAIHGDKNQLQRSHALSEFKNGGVQILVATDVAARGIDIENLSHVINYELPSNPEDYVHRVGRTGRAGSEGNALSLVGENETDLLANIEKLLHTKLKVEKVSGFDEDLSVKNVPDRKNKISAGTTQNYNQHIRNARGEKNGKYANFSYDRALKNNKDPIFTEPYVPQVNVAQSANVERVGSQSLGVYKRDKKIIPALFTAHTRKKNEESN